MYFLLIKKNISITLILSLSYLISTSFAFFMHKKYVFSKRFFFNKDVINQYIKYFFIQLFFLVSNLAIVPFLISKGLNAYFSQFLFLLFTLFVSFILNKYYIFKNHRYEI